MALDVVKRHKALPPVTVHFLGTCSGGGPIVSRNCSSLAVDFGSDIWLFDAADGTLPRLHQSSLKLSNITRIYITHLHADHVLGLVSILTTIMSGIGTTKESLERLKAQGTDKKPNVHIYGTKGLRRLIRVTLEITAVTLAGAYAVHELLPADDSVGSVPCSAQDLHTNEAVGRDIVADGHGVWRDVSREGDGKGGKSWGVSAGPIEHRVPSLGYVLQEPTPREPLDTAKLIPILQANAHELAAADPPVRHPLSLLSVLTSLPPPEPITLPSGDVLHPPPPSGVRPRKLVIFGDCNGGTRNKTLAEMCADASLLIHECTNGSIPELIQRGEKGRKVRMRGMDEGLVQRSEQQTGKKVGGDEPKANDKQMEKQQLEQQLAERESRDADKRVEVRKKAQARGHSVPDDVGVFARTIRAKRVVVNHFSAMFPSPRYASSEPYPSLLSPISPYPYPIPCPPPRSPHPIPDPLPLTGSELHIRLILQALADQINAAWAGGKDVDSHQAIAARDFMVVRVPSHELSEAEVSVEKAYHEQSAEIMEQWKAQGGLWIGDGDKRSWIGVDPEPPKSSSSQNGGAGV